MQHLGASLYCGAQASYCGGFSCGTWAREHMRSVVMAQGFNCSVACGIFPDQGSNLCPLSWQADSHPLPHGIFQASVLENPMDGGAWWATVHGVAKSRTQLSNFTFTFTSYHQGSPHLEFLNGKYVYICNLL